MTDSPVELTSPLVEKAMRLAAEAHRDQTRKASTVPYLSHPASVALILARAGYGDEAVLSAALLHDVVEDTPLTLEQLALEFPEEVVQIVASLSEQKTDDAGVKRPWKDRKVDHIRHLKSASPEAKAVALADKLHNLTSMLHDQADCGDGLWDRFNATREEILWYHDEMIAAAATNDERVARLQAACRAALSQLRAADGRKQ